jgi:branched-chain amino acid transport system permease protein
MSIFLQNTVLLAQDSKDKSIPNLIPGNFSIGPGGAHEVLISYMQIVVFVVTLIAMLGLTLFISRSRLGRACRACAEDIKMANLLGINTNNIIALTFVIGAALAAIAAVLLSMQYGVINPNAGFLVGLKAFTAAVLGGIGSIPGAMLGGLVLGVAEAFGADVFGDQYKDVVAFGLLVLVLLFRPTGILGRPEVEKV